MLGAHEGTASENGAETSTGFDMAPLGTERDWSRGAVRRTDVLDIEPARALGDLLRHLGVASAQHAWTHLPPMWHAIYFHPWEPLGELGPDGHPLAGHFMPPIPNRRRMFAGGRVTFHQPLRHSTTAAADTRIRTIEHKQGRGGDLLFVTLRSELRQGGTLCVEEEQDLVYRSASHEHAKAPSARSAPAGRQGADALASEPADADARAGTHDDSQRFRPLPFAVDAVSLFRFSALTANSHRIHYDTPYATGVEGHPGLVVHGPLIALALAESCRAAQPEAAMSAFEYRLLKPSFESERMTITTEQDGLTRTEATLRGPDGTRRAAARAHFNADEGQQP